MKNKKIHYNVPQLLFHLVRASTNILFWGRATGKTVGPGSDFVYTNVKNMPRGKHAVGSITYDKVLNIVIPKVISRWEQFGYIENVHFWVRKYAPENLHIPKPFNAPLKASHLIHHANGSASPLISIDRPSISNGDDLDSAYLDEIRFATEEKATELLKTVRGNAAVFGRCPGHHSVLITTDLPRDAKGKWLFDFEKEQNHQAVELILKINKWIFETRAAMPAMKKSDQQKAQRIIDGYEKELFALRKNLVFVSYASTIDNIHALGVDVLKKWKRELSDFVFQVSILSKRIKDLTNSFYASLDTDQHGYFGSNYEYIDNEFNPKSYSKSNKDCRFDDDFDYKQPLDIAGDYNAAISWVVVGQEYGQEYRITNSMYIKGKSKLKSLIKKFDTYYKPKKEVNNQINYYYDHTAVGTTAKDPISYADEWINGLRDLGWQVIPHYVGQSWGHHSRRIAYQEYIFNDQQTKCPKFRINLTNNEDLIISMQDAGVKISDDYFKKDKSSEKAGSGVPQEHATHGSEALDGLMQGVMMPRIKGGFSFPG